MASGVWAGKSYGKWKFVRPVKIKTRSGSVAGWLMKCQCGNEKKSRMSNIRRSKRCRSCAGGDRGRNLPFNDPLYRRWRSLRDEGRLERFLMNYKKFVEWMGGYKYVYSDRKDGKVTRATAVRSKVIMTAARSLEVGGVRRSIACWSDVLGFSRQRGSVLHKQGKLIGRIQEHLIEKEILEKKN